MRLIARMSSIINLCYQCSSCTSVCPLRRVSKFNPRKIVHNSKMGNSIDIEDLLGIGIASMINNNKTMKISLSITSTSD